MSLTAFQQSVFLQSLGWAIANNLWQCGLLWIAYKLIAISYSSASARFKNNLSTTLLFCNFLWFVITLFNKITSLQNNAAENSTDQLIYYTSTDIVQSKWGLQNFISSIVFTLPYLSLAYLFLLIIFTIKLINSYCNTNFIKNNGLSKPDGEWRLFVETVANHISINKNIKIWFSKYVDVPATIGFLKPVILIPIASLNQLTAEQVEAIILHEISHIKRNDYIINLFVYLIETILFFNPFVVLLTRIIKKERENCCDDFVLQYQYDRYSYASALLALEKHREHQFHLALAATSGKQQLLFRIKRIMEAKNRSERFNYGQKLFALALSTGIICSLAWLTPEKKTVKTTNKKLLTKIEKNTQLSSEKKSKNNLLSIHYEEAKNAVKSEQKNKADIQGTTATFKKNEKNIIEYKTGDPTEEKDILGYNLNNEDILSERSTISIQPNTSHNDFTFWENPSLSDLHFFKDVYLNIDINKLNDDIEKERRLLSSIDWVNATQQIRESFEAIEPLFNIRIQKNKMNIDKDERAVLNNEREDKLQMQRKNYDKVTRQFRNHKQEIDSLIFNNKKFATDFFYNACPPDFVTPPPPVFVRKEKNLPTLPVPGRQAKPNVYTYEYSTSPDIKLSQLPAMQLNNLKGLVVINGKEINLSDLNKYEIKKIVKKLTGDKTIIEIHSN